MSEASSSSPPVEKADSTKRESGKSVYGYLSAVMKTIDEPLALIDDRGRIEYLNEAFEELLCARLAELQGEAFFSLCQPSDISVADLRQRQSWKGSLRIGDGDLSVPAVLFHTPPRAGGGPGAVIRIGSGTAVADNLQQTFQQTKLESLGVLSSSIVHDLNNILAGILGHVSFLRLSLAEELSSQDSLVAIEDGARKAAAMTQQILDFAKGEEVVLGPVNLSRVVADGLKLLSPSLAENIQLTLSGAEEDLHVVGDAGQLNQLVLNLAVNARDALPQGGSINVELATRKFADPVHCAEVGIEPGEYVLLSVKDSGEGIPDEIADRIFEPFFTTKTDMGTGLGLASVQAIVKAHRGVLSFHTAVGQGTCFEIALPSSPAVEAFIENDDEQALPTGNERILVVDDEDTVRTIMQRSLEHLGYQVETATNGVEALACFEENQGAFQLIIIDMIMPQMPGDELFYRLQEVDKSIGVLVASGYASDSRTKAILEDGALGFIQKPFAVEELAVEVRRCLDTALKERVEEAA